MNHIAIFSLHNVCHIIKKHIFQIAMLVLLVALCLSMFGAVFMQRQTIQSGAKQLAETYGGKYYYRIGEGLNDADYYSYLQERDGKTLAKLQAFYDSLCEEKAFSFVSCNTQFLELTQKFPDMFFYGYEDGTPDTSGNSVNGTTYYQTKSIQVSANYFTVFDVHVSKGREFTADDYIFSEGKNIPVLLGSSYAGTLSIGDTFSGEYLFHPVTFEVIGFLDNSSFFFQNREFISCERYVVLPSLQLNTTEISNDDSDAEFKKLMLLEHMEGMIASESDYETVSNIFYEKLDQAGLGDYSIFVTDPSIYESQSMNSALETYSSMTEEVSNQFEVILILVILLSVAIIVFTICGILQEYRWKYAIYQLCGVTHRQIILDIILLGGVLLLPGVCIARIAFAAIGVTRMGALMLLLMTLCIWVLITVIPSIYLVHNDISDVIGGRE